MSFASDGGNKMLEKKNMDTDEPFYHDMDYDEAARNPWDYIKKKGQTEYFLGNILRSFHVQSYTYLFIIVQKRLVHCMFPPFFFAGFKWN